MALVDYLGRPVRVEALKQEVAGPTLSGVRSIISEHPASGLTPGRLASILRQAENHDALAYLALAEDMEEKDLHYLGVLGTRKRQVSQLPITVESPSDDPDDEANTQLVRDWLERDTLQMELFDILDAVGKGFSRTEIVWDMSERQWLPNRLEWRDPRWFTFDRIDGRTPMLRGDDGFPVPLDAFKYICHDHQAKSGLPIRGGLARPASWAWMFKNYSLKDWVAFAEVYGMPLRMGRYDNGETPENIALLARAVADMGSDAAAVFPKSMEVIFGDGKQSAAGGSAEVYERLCIFLDQQMSKAVLGQTGTTDATTGGFGSSGQVHDEVRGDIENADAKQLSASLNRDIVRPIVDLNRGPPASGKYPRIKIGREESIDIPETVGAVDKLVRLGARIPESWARKIVGAPEPKADEAVLQVSGPPAIDPNADPALGAPGGPFQPGPENKGRTARPPAKAPAGGPRSSRGFSALPPASQRAFHAQGHSSTATGDALDRMIEADLGDWEPVLEAVVDPVREVLARCSTLTEARDRLTEALGAMDDGPFTELLARAGFNAHLAGLAGLDLSDSGTDQ